MNSEQSSIAVVHINTFLAISRLFYRTEFRASKSAGVNSNKGLKICRKLRSMRLGTFCTRANTFPENILLGNNISFSGNFSMLFLFCSLLFPFNASKLKNFKVSSTISVDFLKKNASLPYCTYMAPATDKRAFQINSLYFCNFHVQKQQILFVHIITSSEYFACVNWLL